MTESQDISATRAALIEAGLHLFGLNGFEGSSTRAIAARAQTNVASIAYHFGSKAGLRSACAEAVTTRIGTALAAAEALPLPDDPATARAQLHLTLRAFVQLMIATPEASNFVTFVLREITDQSDIAGSIYDRAFLPRHSRLCALWARATGQPAEAEAVKLSVFALIGQAFYFRLAAPFVTRRMGWPAMAGPQADAILATLAANLDASLDRSQP